MKRLTDMYRPLTASPFSQDDSYCELMPCPALRPYIRCFWGTRRPLPSAAGSGLVIPDTCIDIIFDIDYTDSCWTGGVCCVDERSHRTVVTDVGAKAHINATFAIRFYAWTAVLFAERDLSSTRNRYFPVDEFFSALRKELQPLLFDVPTLTGKAAAAERFLLKRLDGIRVNNDLMNVLHMMISSCGRARLTDICGSIALSERSLERIFSSHIGVSPKTFSDLVRYQLLWQELMSGRRFDAADAVERFGYFDQAHLLNDFRKRHLMGMRDAVELAMKLR